MTNEIPQSFCRDDRRVDLYRTQVLIAYHIQSPSLVFFVNAVYPDLFLASWSIRALLRQIFKDSSCFLNKKTFCGLLCSTSLLPSFVGVRSTTRYPASWSPVRCIWSSDLSHEFWTRISHCFFAILSSFLGISALTFLKLWILSKIHSGSSSPHSYEQHLPLPK